MYLFLSIFASLTTVLMFLRMHHVHGSDSSTERIIITIGCVIFLLQAGLTYHSSQTSRYSHKRWMTLANVLFTVLFSLLFFWFVDFNRDSVFSTLLGGE